jgi:predicted nucleic acid-binding protein
MQRLFLDANVLFTAAHNPKGKAALLIELAQVGAWQLVTSAYAREEARRNLERKYPDAVSVFDRQLVAIRVIADSEQGDCPDGLPVKDCPIYRAAMICQADVLLTGDLRDFGFLMNDRSKANGLLVQTVGDFLNAI